MDKAPRHILNQGTLLPAILFIAILTILAFSATVHADGFPIIGVLHAGQHPEAMAVDTQTHMLYIAYETPGLIVAFDPASGKVRWRNPLGNVATDIQVDSTSHRVYVSTSFGRQSTLSILDGKTGWVLFTARIASGDNGIALDAKRQRVYVSGDNTGIVSVLTFLSGWQQGAIQVRSSQLHVGSHPRGIGVNSRLGRLYVADAAEHKVTVLDEDSGHVLATIPVANVPLHPLRVDEATGRVYVVCSTGQELDVIDGNTNRMLARIPVAPYPEGVTFNTTTGRIYVADEGNEENSPGVQDIGTTITIIDGHSLEVVGTLQVGHAPDGVVSDPALHRVYIALEDDNAVVELADSVDIPLKSDTTRQEIAAHQVIFALQQATIITLIVMFLTLVGATLAVLSPRWRVRESPQTPRADASSRSERHTLPL